MLAEAIDGLESFLTPQDEFGDVSRGTPKPHSLTDEQKGTWDSRGKLGRWMSSAIRSIQQNSGQGFTKEQGTAITFDQLMMLAETHAVRFAKVMTCLNMGCPLGMGIWEGVPLREIIWQTEAKLICVRFSTTGITTTIPIRCFAVHCLSGACWKIIWSAAGRSVFETQR
ncbi:MAG: hypothetical protein R3C02_05390 [Planctomycetaceae bacterium]